MRSSSAGSERLERNADDLQASGESRDGELADLIRAGSEEHARSLASKVFDTTLAPSSPGGKIATPLWHHSYAVRAEVMQDQRYASEGPAGILEPRGYT